MRNIPFSSLYTSRIGREPVDALVDGLETAGDGGAAPLVLSRGAVCGILGTSASFAAGFKFGLLNIHDMAIDAD